MFSVVGIMIGGSIAGEDAKLPGSSITMSTSCWEADMGKNEFVKGTGRAVKNGKEFGFGDFCYTETPNDRVDSCSEPPCYLKEIYCSSDGVEIESEGIECKHGCANGACIPGSLSKEGCKIEFNMETYEWGEVSC
jgi:hypothetical protein